MSIQRSVFDFTKYLTIISLGLKKLVAKYLTPTSASVIYYVYQNILERSPLRKLLIDIFIYNVKIDTLNENILLFSVEFIANILFINIKRLSLRLYKKKIDFNKNADKYHVDDLSSTFNNRKQRTFEDVKVGGTTFDFDSRDEPAAEAAISESEPSIEAIAVNKNNI